MDNYTIPDHMAVVGDDDTDGERTQALAMKIMNVVKDHLKAGPTAPARVYEALNALAVNASIMIVGGDRARCGELFRASLNANLEIYYQAQEGHDEQEAGESGPTIH